jgi:hypothetical protein
MKALRHPKFKGCFVGDMRTPVTRALIGIVLVACAACDKTTADTYATAGSAAGYEVRLIGTLRSPSLPFIENVIKFEALGPNRRRLGAGELYRGSFRDSGFRDRYPSEEWEYPNVLRFVASHAPSVTGRDEITVTNDSTQHLANVRLLSTDLYVILDLPPLQSVLVRPTQHLLYLGVDGEFANGTRLSHVSYETSDLPAGVGRFQVSIGPARTAVTRVSD